MPLSQAGHALQDAQVCLLLSGGQAQPGGAEGGQRSNRNATCRGWEGEATRKGACPSERGRACRPAGMQAVRDHAAFKSAGRTTLTLSLQGGQQGSQGRQLLSLGRLRSCSRGQGSVG